MSSRKPKWIMSRATKAEFEKHIEHMLRGWRGARHQAWVCPNAYPLHTSSETLYRPHFQVSTGALKSCPASKAGKTSYLLTPSVPRNSADLHQFPLYRTCVTFPVLPVRASTDLTLTSLTCCESCRCTGRQRRVKVKYSCKGWGKE